MKTNLQLGLFFSLLLAASTLNAQVNIGAATAPTGNTMLQVTTAGTKTGVAVGYAATAPTDGAIIKGNVAIGTTTPTAKLHVAGKARIEDIPQNSLMNSTPTVQTLHPVYADPSGNIVKYPHLSFGADTIGIIRIFYFGNMQTGVSTPVTQITSLSFTSTYEITVALANSSSQQAVARFLFTGNDNTGQSSLRYVDGNTDITTQSSEIPITATYTYNPAATGLWNGLNDITEAVVDYGSGITLTLKAGENLSNNPAFSVSQATGDALMYVTVKKIF